mgnify:CR=1 FL=1
MATKVTLRQRELKSGKITLYLDYYPPVRDLRTREYVRHDYLGIYLVKNPREGYEKRSNKEKLMQAEAIRAEREQHIDIADWLIKWKLEPRSEDPAKMNRTFQKVAKYFSPEHHEEILALIEDFELETWW